jgi:hypothetical protein
VVCSPTTAGVVVVWRDVPRPGPVSTPSTYTFANDWTVALAILGSPRVPDSVMSMVPDAPHATVRVGLPAIVVKLVDAVEIVPLDGDA